MTALLHPHFLLSSATWADCLPLIIMACWAAVTDLRDRRIRNWLTLSMLATGLMQHFLMGGFPSFGWALLGAIAGFLIAFPLFAIGAFGGGDVKLLAGVGAWVGAVTVTGVFLGAALVGLVMALGIAANARQLTPLLRNSVSISLSMMHVREVGLEHTTATARECRVGGRPLPYAVPVLISLLAVLAVVVGLSGR